MDFETYSEAGYQFSPALGRFISTQKNKPGLQAINAAVYAEHPSTRVICLAYDMQDGNGTRLWVPGDKPPINLWRHIHNGGLIEAHNSGFEWYIWNLICCRRMGWPRLPLYQLRCSAAQSRAHGLPGALAKVAKATGVDEQKNDRGKQLIRLLSIPKNPTKKDARTYRRFDLYPELYLEMYEYCLQDVEAEKAVSARVPELTQPELNLWLLDQDINARGVAIDTESLNACIGLYYRTEQKYTERLQQITGGAVESVGKMTKLKAGDKWLQSHQGVNLPNLDKSGVSDALKRTDLPAPAREALEIRQEIGGSSVKKIFALRNRLNSDGRVRELFQYCGAARTGRWAGRGPQPQNLKNGGPDCHECGGCGLIWSAKASGVCPACGVDPVSEPDEWGNRTACAALNDIRTQPLETVEARWGSSIDLIGSCMRSLFIARPGYDLICSDYSAIEAVVLAALAGEEWRLEVFRTHGKIYEASVAAATGTPVEEILEHKRRTGKHHPLRKRGKVRELAYGYCGWIGAAKNFGADSIMTDEEIKQDILSWREESPNIPEMWGGQYRKEPGRWQFHPELYGAEGMFISALIDAENTYRFRELAFRYDSNGDRLYLTLPSGRSLIYHRPRLGRGIDKRGLSVWEISYMGIDGYTGRWMRLGTYGGKLTENIVQAVSRDILAAAMLRVSAAGYPIVLHVHDEIVAEVPTGTGSVEEFENLMEQREPWFADWPIRAAGGWRGKRYRK